MSVDMKPAEVGINMFREMTMQLQDINFRLGKMAASVHGAPIQGIQSQAPAEPPLPAGSSFFAHFNDLTRKLRDGLNRYDAITKSFEDQFPVSEHPTAIAGLGSSR